MRIASPVSPVSLASLVTPVSLVAVVAVAAGCDPGDSDRDVTPPRVLSVEPLAPVVPVDVALRVTLSEHVDSNTVDGDPVSDTLTVALVPRAQASEAFLADFKNPGISETRQGQLVPVEVDADSDVINVTPTRPLEPRTAYTLLLGADIRDTAQNPLVDGTGLKATFRYDFQTDDGQPEVSDVDVDGTALIAPNRRRISVQFNQPVQNVTQQTVTLSPEANVEAVLLNAERTSATLLLAENASGCARLTPSTTYTLSLSNAIVGDTGQKLAPFSAEFTTGGSCDTSPNLIVDGPDAIAGEVAATIRFETTKASTTEVRFGLTGGALDCGGAACPAVGNAARAPIPGASPPRFLHSVELTGLTVGNSYDVVVSAEDDVGITASARLTFVTAPLPKVGLNEVMANPPASFSSEAQGEYVELVNFGDVAVDVSHWAVLVEGGEDGGGCTAELPDGVVLPAGGFLIVAGKDFDGTNYALAADAPLVRLTSSTGSNGMCSLVNSRAQPFLLTDGDGRPVSSVSSYASIVPDEDGRSVERTAPDAADVESSFCYSRDDAGPTPGRANSVAAAGCD